ncbi:MAG TPA: hypothetical protein VH395_15435 [Jatrophihabitantaceae bacterium]|jgi:hypothetical protein
MPKNKSGSSATDTRLYAALRKEGIKKKKAKRITAAVKDAARPAATKRSRSKGPKATPYEKWTRAELLQRAKTVGVKGRSRMTKAQLTRALRAS